MPLDQFSDDLVPTGAYAVHQVKNPVMDFFCFFKKGKIWYILDIILK
jgi:hypothetical protein